MAEGVSAGRASRAGATGSSSPEHAPNVTQAAVAMLMSIIFTKFFFAVITLNILIV
jgi:hypothetical protein